MRFCFISENYFGEISGGAEIQCYHISQELIKRGHEVYYIYKSSIKRRSYIEKGINVYPLFCPKFLQKAVNKSARGRVAVEYLMLHRAMIRIKADFWYYRSVNTFLVSLVKIKNKIGGRLIYSLSMDMQTSAKEWINRFGHSYHEAFVKSLRYVDHFLFQKEEQRIAFKDQYGYDGTIILNGHPLPEGINRDHKNMVTWIGNFRELKRPDLFLQLVKEYQGSPGIRFNMIGRPAPKYNHQLEHVTKSCSNFNYHGYLENDEVLPIIKNSYLTISTSISEGFPNVFIESWKYGVPVLTFINPDSVVSNNNVGFVCNDIQEMISKINFLIENPGIYDQLSQNCLELFSGRFSITNNVNKLFSLIGCESSLT